MVMGKSECHTPYVNFDGASILHLYIHLIHQIRSPYHGGIGVHHNGLPSGRPFNMPLVIEKRRSGFQGRNGPRGQVLHVRLDLITDILRKGDGTGKGRGYGV